MDELIIEAGRTEAHYWRDLWRYRDLFYFLAWRDLLVRYKQTVFGDLPPLNGTASRERIWGWSKPREATNATRKEGTG